jgi:hypothetical protein
MLSSCKCVLGGGVEPDAHYSQWRRIHQSMERYHVLQESIIKLVEGEPSSQVVFHHLYRLA